MPCPWQLLAPEGWDRAGGVGAGLWSHADLGLNPPTPFPCLSLAYSSLTLLIKCLYQEVVKRMEEDDQSSYLFGGLVCTRCWAPFVLSRPDKVPVTQRLEHSTCSTCAAPLSPSVPWNISSKAPYPSMLIAKRNLHGCKFPPSTQVGRQCWVPKL